MQTAKFGLAAIFGTLLFASAATPALAYISVTQNPQYAMSAQSMYGMPSFGGSSSYSGYASPSPYSSYSGYGMPQYGYGMPSYSYSQPSTYGSSYYSMPQYAYSMPSYGYSQPSAYGMPYYGAPQYGYGGYYGSVDTYSFTSGYYGMVSNQPIGGAFLPNSNCLGGFCF